MIIRIFKTLLTVLFMVFAVSCGAESKSITTKAELAEQLKDLEKICPATLLTRKKLDYEDLLTVCEERETYCIKRCSKDDAGACIALANIYGENTEDYTISRNLFKHSCKLGLPSGCTNAAAGMLHVDQSAEGTCILEAFRGACDLKDPWGCTMEAIMLSDKRYIDIVERDFEAALEALKGSCTFGLSDPACSGAKEIEDMILTAMKK